MGRATSPAAHPQTLFVRLPNWVGDVCMCLPSLDAALATGLNVVVCARPWAQDLLAGYPLHGFVTMQSGWRANCTAVRAAVRALAASTPPPLGLLLPDSLSSALSFRLAGIPCAGYRDDGRSLLLRWPIRKSGQATEAQHAVASWYGLARAALAAWDLPTPAPAPPRSLGLRLTAQHQSDARAALMIQGIEAGNFVLIAPTATGLHRGQIKVWPHFDALTRRLQGAGHTVLMCPPPAEVAAAQAAAPTALCLPSLGLGAFAALAARAKLVVCNDSGVSHLAAAVGARQITLIGVTDAARTGPWSSRAECLGVNGHWPGLDHVFVRARRICA